MSNDVFANGREISCKKADGKTICEFPDVCFTPPENPATPPGVPVPYPNTAFAKDTTEGSKTVKISGQEVMLKNKSYIKTSTGDEAGCAAKKGLITSKIKGKAYFISWSMDVKVEGENVVRHLDQTTNNHASPMANGSAPMAHPDSASPPKTCDDYEDDAEAKCENTPPHPDGGLNCSDQCKDAKACILVRKCDDKDQCCNPDTTGDHLVEDNCFMETSGRKGEGLATQVGMKAGEIKALANVTLQKAATSARPLHGFSNYNTEHAPCVCVGPNHAEQKHHALQSARDRIKLQYIKMRNHQPIMDWGKEKSFWTYDEASSAGAKAHKEVFPKCDEKCIKKQIDAYHVGELNIDRNDPVKTETVLVHRL
jgi:Domain of unknown function (DUF4150)/GHH signature containing HNH/Endo VII superfamily nuclease toxin  2